MIKGIDVSANNGIINWQNVNGIDFVMVKATQGRGCSKSTELLRNFTDSKFKNNIQGAFKKGFKCGVYHFLTASNVKEAEKEADYFIKVIMPYKDKISLYAAVDVEDAAESKYSRLPKTKTELTNIVNAFTDKISKAGFKPAIYTNRDFLQNRMYFDGLKCKTIWRAHWFSNYATSFEMVSAEQKPIDYATDMPLWQFGMAQKGYISGINSEIDINYGYYEKVAETPDFCRLVSNKCRFEQQTINYLNQYKYADELWRRLWEAMK